MSLSDPAIVSASPAEELTPPDVSAFTHTPCYCEENVYLLCKNLCRMGVTDGEGRDLFAVFISNENRRRHGRGNALHQVWDLDTTLPFPVPLDQYVAEAVRPSLTLDSCFTRLFRVVHAPLFLRCFASDRRHMKNPNGHWMSPPPTYEPIIAEDGAIYNLDKYIQMSAKDVVTNTGDLVERIFSERFGVIMNEMQVEEFFSMLSNGNSS
ncbi:protein N-terminal glutamine amidohydrolase isoform X2 [Aristolochia californica]|uniref:protein N-terminal glutamine amidohydrolase isoform X2 n=1 Tax=Aristolochia californica TaxID=171875 RepID=UPI0035DF6F5D